MWIKLISPGMSMRPMDSAFKTHMACTSSLGLGREATLGDVFRAADRVCRRHFWPMFARVGLRILILTAIYAGAVLLAWMIEKSSSPHPLRAWVATFLILSAAYGVYAFVQKPIWHSCVWAAVKAFEDHRPRFGGLLRDLVAGFPVALLVGLAESLFLIPTWALSCCVFAGLPLLFPVRLLFLFTPVFAYTENRTSFTGCLRENWRVLNRQAGRFFFLMIISMPPFVVAGAAAGVLSRVFASRYNALVDDWPSDAEVVRGVRLLLLVAPLAFAVCCSLLVYYTFLKAAFFRAACGYALAEPSSVPAPITGPAGQPGPSSEVELADAPNDTAL